MHTLFVGAYVKINTHWESTTSLPALSTAHIDIPNFPAMTFNHFSFWTRPAPAEWWQYYAYGLHSSPLDHDAHSSKSLARYPAQVYHCGSMSALLIDSNCKCWFRSANWDDVLEWPRKPHVQVLTGMLRLGPIKLDFTWPGISSSPSIVWWNVPSLVHCAGTDTRE